MNEDYLRGYTKKNANNNISNLFELNASTANLIFSCFRKTENLREFQQLAQDREYGVQNLKKWLDDRCPQVFMCVVGVEPRYVRSQSFILIKASNRQIFIVQCYPGQYTLQESLLDLDKKPLNLEQFLTSLSFLTDNLTTTSQKKQIYKTLFHREPEERDLVSSKFDFMFYRTKIIESDYRKYLPFKCSLLDKAQLFYHEIPPGWIIRSLKICLLMIGFFAIIAHLIREDKPKSHYVKVSFSLSA